jgi:hypothetical protein
VKVTLLDLEDSLEQAKKESFTNEGEANAVADLLLSF